MNQNLDEFDNLPEDDGDDLRRMFLAADAPRLVDHDLTGTVLKAGRRRRTVRRVTMVTSPIAVAAVVTGGFLLWAPNNHANTVPATPTVSTPTDPSTLPGPTTTPTSTASAASQSSTPSGSTSSPSSASSPTTIPVAPADQRVVLVGDRVAVINRSTGAPIKTLAQVAPGVEIDWAAVTSDGSVLVRRQRSDIVSSDLARVTETGFSTVISGVQSATLNPSRTRVAYTFVDPDDNGDGKALDGYRSAAVSGGTVRDLKIDSHVVTSGLASVVESLGQLAVWVGDNIVVDTSFADNSCLFIDATDPSFPFKAVGGNLTGSPVGVKPDGSVLVWGAGGSSPAEWLASIGADGSTTRVRAVSGEPSYATIAGLGYTPLRVQPGDVKYTGPGAITKVLSN